ncbi:MAG: hypothetical protein DESF_01459 [Desulfovibrio sp.]
MRCIGNCIRQHRFQRLKGRGIESMVECGRVVKEILHAVDRVNAQAIHQALLFSNPSPSSRLVTIDEKAKNISAVSQDIQQEIQAVVDGKNAQYIQDYLKEIRLKLLNRSCIKFSAVCERTINEIFRVTDSIDAQFIAQWLAQRSTANPINTLKILEPNPPRTPDICNINSAEAQPRLQIYSNGVIRVNLDAPESVEPESAEDAPDNTEDTAIDNAPK